MSENEASKAQSEWVKIGANLRTGLDKKVSEFAKGSGFSDPEGVRTLVMAMLEALELDILANAFDQAVQNRIQPIDREDGEGWRGDD